MLVILWVTANAKQAVKTLRKVMHVSLSLMSWSPVIAIGAMVSSPPTRDHAPGHAGVIHNCGLQTARCTMVSGY